MADKFEINKNDLYDVLNKGEIEYLYHANTVSTSVTFFNERALLSRKYVEDNNLAQSSQSSDEKDKSLNIWDGIFLDFIDIHKELKRPNLYGPLLFCFDLNILLSDQIASLKITKKNPVYWRTNETDEDWYYTLDEFKEKYKSGRSFTDFGTMIILNEINGRLNLRPYLKKLILDNPNIIIDFRGERKEIRDYVKDHLNEIFENDADYSFIKEVRKKCHFYKCRCFYYYNSMNIRNIANFKRLFSLNGDK